MSSSTLALVVRHPKLKALYGLWLRLCAGGSFPALDGMSPADLRPWLDNMAILGLDETGGYVYRYYSPAYASAFGGDTFELEQIQRYTKGVKDLRSHMAKGGKDQKESEEA